MSNNVACPACFAGIDRRLLWFQCSGGHTPGRPSCAEVIDRERYQETGFREFMLPVFQTRENSHGGQAACPACGSITATRACPYCHTPLPSGFEDSHNLLIAVVGTLGSGKSTFLRVLAHELSNRTGLEGNRPRPGTTIFPGGRLPEITQQAIGGLSETVQCSTTDRNGRGIHLTFADVSGSDLARQEHVDDLRCLTAADAIMFLVDPLQLPTVTRTLGLGTEYPGKAQQPIDALNRISEHLRMAHNLGGRSNISIPAALVVAKFDAVLPTLEMRRRLARRQRWIDYDEQHARFVDEYLRALFHRRWHMDDLDVHLRHNYQRFRLFGVSALGRSWGPEQLVGTVRPHEVLSPLRWILETLRIQPGDSKPI